VLNILNFLFHLQCELIYVHNYIHWVYCNFLICSYMTPRYIHMIPKLIIDLWIMTYRFHSCYYINQLHCYRMFSPSHSFIFLVWNVFIPFSLLALINVYKLLRFVFFSTMTSRLNGQIHVTLNHDIIFFLINTLEHIKVILSNSM